MIINPFHKQRKQHTPLKFKRNSWAPCKIEKEEPLLLGKKSWEIAKADLDMIWILNPASQWRLPIPLCQYRKDASLKTQSCTSQVTVQKTKLAIPFYCQAKQTRHFIHASYGLETFASLFTGLFLFLSNECFKVLLLQTKQPIHFWDYSFIFHQDFYKCPKMNLSILSLIRGYTCFMPS